jgi:Sulfotransferase family
MIVAGGMPMLTDGLRSPDENNPRGYQELESVKTLAKNPEVIAAAEGKVVKVISSLLQSLPAGHEYRIIFMCRLLEEVIASQNKMLQRLGREVPSTPLETVIAAFNKHLRLIRSWLAEQPNMTLLYVDYAAVLENPRAEASKICAFLGQNFDVDAMADQVERSLHREKISS